MSLTNENILGASDSTLPSFVTGSNNTLVTSVGQTIYLYCGVNNLGDRQVCKLSISYCRQQGDRFFLSVLEFATKLSKDLHLKLKSPLPTCHGPSSQFGNSLNLLLWKRKERLTANQKLLIFQI